MALFCSLSGAAEAAEAAAAPTYDDVLAAPDDVQLNLGFAQAEQAAGRLLSAAAAYERILILRPEWDSVRLAYAKVLYALDDRAGAREQLQILSTRKLAAGERDEADRLRRRLSTDGRNSVSGYLATGAIYQTNAFGQFYSQFNLPGQVRSERGADAVVSASLEDVLQISDDGRLAGYLSLSGYHQSPIVGPDTRYQVGEARIGLSGAPGQATWRLGGLRRVYRLFGAPYIAETGGQADLSVAVGDRARVETYFEGVWQDYHEPLVAETLAGLGGGHNGPRYSASVVLILHPRRQDVAILAGGYEAKSAGYRPFAYDAPYVDASYSLPAGRVGWITLRAQRRRLTGREPDPIYLGGARERDRFTSVRIDYEAPIGRMLDPAGQRRALDGLGLQAGLGYDSRRSAPPLAGYDSIGGRVLLIWRFQSRK
jgi:hypothetical protein